MKARLPDGYGKQNVNQLMKQAQEMQDRMQEKQQELEEREYTGTSGGGMVEVVMLGSYEVTSVKIKPDIVSADEIDMLEDMVGAAMNDAVRSIKETSETEMAEISSGFNIPGIPGMSGL